MMPKTLNDVMNCVTRTKNRCGVSNGIVIRRTVLDAPAPSISAAS
jgi:hypothetical protein